MASCIGVMSSAPCFSPPIAAAIASVRARAVPVMSRCTPKAVMKPTPSS